MKIRQGVVIIRTLPIICGAHQFHSFLPLFLLSLLLKQRDLQPEQFVAVRIDKNRNPPLVFFVAVRTHNNQDKPLAVDANVSASHGWRSRLQILERAQIFSAIYIITLRVSHQPQGDKPKINTMSIEVAITSLRLVREPTDQPGRLY